MHRVDGLQATPAQSHAPKTNQLKVKDFLGYSAQTVEPGKKMPASGQVEGNEFNRFLLFGVSIGLHVIAVVTVVCTVRENMNSLLRRGENDCVPVEDYCSSVVGYLAGATLISVGSALNASLIYKSSNSTHQADPSKGVELEGCENRAFENEKKHETVSIDIDT
nr:hypothetical protein [Endozoicomonas sp.]